MKTSSKIQSISPLLGSLGEYRIDLFVGDLIAGLVVAIMLVPQAMAYAMLAGLPPEIGLYASIVPLILYSFLGTSNALAVGPVAMVSLIVLSGVSQLATPGSSEFIRLCLTLALLVGGLQVAMAAFRLGFLVNFISHPVLVGFTSAAAIVIGFSQVKHLFGISVGESEYPYQLIAQTLGQFGNANIMTLLIGIASCVLLVLFNYGIAPFLKRIGVQPNIAVTVAKIGPLVAVALAALLVRQGSIHQTHAVAIVGEIPSGLPGLTMPDLRWSAIETLLPLAMVITLVGYMESISVAKALASRKREQVDANRELLALGMADVGAAFTGGYPVTGGFSRSMVNYSAGVCTPLGSVFTALFVAIAVVFLTPLFFYIPKAVLAAIILVAVTPLIDFQAPLKLWRYCRSDAVALVATFIAVLATGIELGILIGVVTTIMLLMWKMSKPHVAEVGRVGDSEHFRNVLRHDVQLTQGVLAIRVDESLNFANAPFLLSYVMDQVSQRPDIKSVLLISSGINDIDSTGIEVLETIIRELNVLDIGFFMSDVKGPVTDRLQLAGFEDSFLTKHIFLSAEMAICELTCKPDAC